MIILNKILAHEHTTTDNTKLKNSWFNAVKDYDDDDNRTLYKYLDKIKDETIKNKFIMFEDNNGYNSLTLHVNLVI